MVQQNKQFVILGLGIFGSTIAKKLSSYNYEVIAVDKSMDCVNRVSEYVTQAIKADFTDIDQLRAIDVSECDAAIVATGSLLEESIMAIMNLKELGVPYIIAKAKNRKYMQVLEKLGADRVVRPEKEMGVRIAKQLISKNIVDLIDIDKEYSMVEMLTPKKWVDKTLIELNLRDNYGLNVIGIRKKGDSHLDPNPDPNEKISDDDTIFFIADHEMFTKIDDIVE
jgi:trk system potassium uptake protein TrkA